jgi:hypothetical protein
MISHSAPPPLVTRAGDSILRPNGTIGAATRGSNDTLDVVRNASPLLSLDLEPRGAYSGWVQAPSPTEKLRDSRGPCDPAAGALLGVIQTP